MQTSILHETLGLRGRAIWRCQICCHDNRNF